LEHEWTLEVVLLLGEVGHLSGWLFYLKDVLVVNRVARPLAQQTDIRRLLPTVPFEPVVDRPHDLVPLAVLQLRQPVVP
jgi:hypothetical protein